MHAIDRENARAGGIDPNNCQRIAHKGPRKNTCWRVSLFGIILLAEGFCWRKRLQPAIKKSSDSWVSWKESGNYIGIIGQDGGISGAIVDSPGRWDLME